jgi:predicted lipoprotein
MKEHRLFLNLIAALLVTTTACTLATVRTIEEDRIAKEGFNAERYVNEIWDSQLMPEFQENAVEVTDILAQIDADEDAAIQAYGNRSGTGAYSFLIYGDAQVLEVDLESRIGLMSLDFAPYDSEPDANMAIGPVIRNRNNAVRDAVGFIQFNDFVNQTEFAGVGSAIKDRILRDVISALDLDSIEGKTIHFYGAFTLDDRSDIEIVPVTLEVTN